MEALVFEEEISEYADMTLPNTDYQDSKLEPFIDDLEKLFGKVNIYIYIHIYIYI